MADVVRSVRQVAIARRRKSDTWVAVTALTAAVLALPFAQSSWHGAEAAAVLAVSATAMLAGQRWAIALVVLAEIMLVPSLWPRTFVDGELATNLVGLVTIAALVPGILAMRRAAAALVLVTGRARTQRTCRQFHAGIVLVGVFAALLPIL